ncbi:MAG: DegT/DnrJ/EryC1/StrS family aminotransferase, partial [Candidatus Bathyarchaeota archaeon]
EPDMEKLAIEGGEPVRKKPLPAEADSIGDEEISMVLEALKDKRLRRSAVADEYEAALAKYFGVKHALAVANGTVSMHAILAALDLGPGDEVITTPYTFVATASVVLMQNAIPIFADIDPDYLTIDPEDVERKISERTKGIIPVSITGQPPDMGSTMEVAEHNHLWVMEDAAQSPGATYKDRLIGTFGVASSFSTISGKIIATGEGGFILTDDDDLYERIWSYHNFARKRELGWASKYFWGIPCTNYRLTEIQSAIGLAQLRKLDQFLEIRSRNAEYLTRGIKDIEGIEPPKEPPWGKRVYYYYVIKLDLGKLGASLLEFAKALSTEGVYDYHYTTTTRVPVPCHLQEMFTKKVGYGKTKCPYECQYYGKTVEYKKGQHPNAERACKDVLWLLEPHPLMMKEDLDDVINALEKVARTFTRRQSSSN